MAAEPRPPAGPDAELAASRTAFEQRVRSVYAARSDPRGGVGGKGSPPVLLATGVVGSGSLAMVAVLLGGGLLLVPAAIPLVTVLAVLVTRQLAKTR